MDGARFDPQPPRRFPLLDHWGKVVALGLSVFLIVLVVETLALFLLWERNWVVLSLAAEDATIIAVVAVIVYVTWRWPVRSPPVASSVDVNSEEISVRFPDGTHRLLEWRDPAFDIQVGTVTIRGRPVHGLIATGWRSHILIPPEAIERIRRTAEERGMVLTNTDSETRRVRGHITRIRPRSPPV